MKKLVVNFLFCLTLIDVHSTFYYCPKSPESTFQDFKYLENTYDITGLDVYFHYKGEDAQGHNYPFLGDSRLYDTTCAQSKSFTIPSQDKKIWLPDQVSEIKVLDRTIVENMTSYGVFRDDYTKWMAQQVGLGSLNYGAGYHQCDLEKDQKEDLLINGQVIVEASVLVHLYNVTVNKTKFKPPASFKRYVDNYFVKTFEEIPETYGEFIDTYGTHFFETATFGGRTSIKYFIESKTYLEKQSQINELIKSDFKHFFATLIEGNQSTIPGLKSRQYFQVGTFWTYPRNTLNQTEWLKCLPRDPSIVGGQLKPITDLIYNESTKTQVQKAVKFRMAKTFLREMRQILSPIEVNYVLQSAYYLWILFPYLEVSTISYYNASLHYLMDSCQDQLETNDDNLELIYSIVTSIVKFVDFLRGTSFSTICFEKSFLLNFLDKCTDMASQKWKLPSDFKAKETCCAMYDYLDWVLKYADDCSICSGEDLNDLQEYCKAARNALSQSLCSTIPYDKYSEMCTQDGKEFEFNETCPTGYSKASKTTPFEYKHSTSSHFKTWTIVLIVMLIITTAIIVLIGLYLYCQFPKQKHTLSVHKSEASLKDANNQMKTSSLQVDLKQEKSKAKSQIGECKRSVLTSAN